MSITKHGDSFAIGSYKHVVINVLRGNPGVSTFDLIIARTRQVAREHPQSQVVINIVQSNAFLPSAEERKVLSAKREELEAVGKVTNIFVLEAKGFVAAGFLAVVAGVSFLAGKAQLMFPSTDDALEAALEGVPPAERASFAADLRATIEAVRAA